MNTLTLMTTSYFDGTRHHTNGPYRIDIHDGVIVKIERDQHQSPASNRVINAPFVMPGLVEAHCHLFLDGNELDLEKRKQYLSAPRAQMLEIGRQSLAENLAAGVTLIRDAGDIHGINHELRQELSQGSSVTARLRSPGRAIRKAGRYGGFMAEETTDARSIEHTVRKLASTADDLKILLTGIIDFEKGQMKGGVQFDLDETRLIVAVAREHGLKTFAHCSGIDGLRIAVEAGIDSIEHGFFMDRSIVNVMADKGIAWVPTFSPVWFQYEHPHHCQWNQASVEGLKRILDNHFEYIAVASDAGVPIVAGSDAGSFGAGHGRGLVDELMFHRRAGLSLEKVLASGTSTPRRLWNCPSADIAVGNQADLLILEGSPFDALDNLRRVRCVVRGVSQLKIETPLLTKESPHAA